MPDSGEMSDVEKISQLIARYARGLDTRDFDMVRDCFALDAHAEYGGEQLEGAESIVKYVHAVENFKATTHVVTNVVIELSGSTATVGSQAIAYMVSNSANPDTIRMRGIRYDDVVAKRDGRWLIIDRRHRADWSALVGSHVEVPPAR